MQNMGIYEVVKEGLADLGIDIHELEDKADAGLGNGGLGRLAACFLDSIRFLGLSSDMETVSVINMAFLSKKIVDGKQREFPDQWLINGKRLGN